MVRNRISGSNPDPEQQRKGRLSQQKRQELAKERDAVSSEASNKPLSMWPFSQDPQGTADAVSTSKHEYERMARKLEAKANTFKSMGEAALQQEKALLSEVGHLRSSKTVTPSAQAAGQVEPGISALIQAPAPSILASEWNELATTLEDHITSLAERFRRELSVLVVYLRRAQLNLDEQEKSLYSLLTYAIAAVQTDTPLASFFPKFITYLAPDAHLCEYPQCRDSLFQPEDTDHPTPLEPTAPTFSHSEFHLTTAELDLYSAAIPAGGNVTQQQLLDVEYFYKRLIGNMRTVMESMDQRQAETRDDTRAIHERMEEMARQEADIRKVECRSQDTLFVVDPRDLVGASQARLSLDNHSASVLRARKEKPESQAERNVETAEDLERKVRMEEVRKEAEFCAEAVHRGWLQE